MSARFAISLVTLSLGTASLLPSQTPAQPQLVLTIFGGLMASRHVWTLNDQPFFVHTLLGANPQIDTLDLSRGIVPAFAGGLMATYFPGPHLGFQAEVSFLGMTMESHCRLREAQPPDPANINPQLCTSLQGRATTSSAVNISVGIIDRLAPQAQVSPYARLHAGVVTRTRGSIEMIGYYFDPSVSTLQGAPVLEDDHPNKTSIGLTAAVGVTIGLGPGYQLRFEGRDHFTRLDRVTGPADPAGDPSTGALAPPHAGAFFHNFVFVAGLDIVLERRRGRRY